MEIFCNLGDPLLNKGAEIVIKNSAERVLAAVGDYELPRVVLSFREEDADDEDIMILLYHGETPPVFACPCGGVLRSPCSVWELERMVGRLIIDAVKNADENPSAVALPTDCSEAEKLPKQSLDVPVEAPVFCGCRVSFGDVTVRLTKTEAAVFSVLYENRGKPVSRDRLAETVWGKDVKTNLCDVYICRLRTALCPIFGKGFLVNLRKDGYMMV